MLLKFILMFQIPTDAAQFLLVLNPPRMLLPTGKSRGRSGPSGSAYINLMFHT